MVSHKRGGGGKKKKNEQFAVYRGATIEAGQQPLLSALISGSSNRKRWELRAIENRILPATEKRHGPKRSERKNGKMPVPARCNLKKQVHEPKKQKAGM